MGQVEASQLFEVATHQEPVGQVGARIVQSKDDQA